MSLMAVYCPPDSIVNLRDKLGKDEGLLQLSLQGLIVSLMAVYCPPDSIVNLRDKIGLGLG